ncbi:glycosyltransferase family 2 protein [Rothia aeria]|uniref:glycosyltransferase family 2 protein n=1 Tax=Rothia aeria TaxID=172042 RepID=UPI0028E313A4|nr:glycosyltransferase family 2 protein [Rothia aeria]
MPPTSQTVPRTSIIMPVYKTANTVVKAIESVLNQSDPDFELLIMIDGSPDNSAQLIAEYLQQNPDERVRVFNNPKNQGLSAMRNQGLDEARGEWVTFPDSDDTLYPTFLERLHYHAERTGAQVVNCAHNMVATDGSTTQRLKGAPGTLTGQEAAFALLKDQLSPYAWDKIIRRELFEDVRYPQIERAEDECALLDCYLRAQSVTVIDEPLYAYAVSAGSLTWSRITPLSETARLLEYFEKSLQRTSTYHLPAGQEALIIAKVIAYLNNAQQALVVGGAEAPRTLAACCRGFSFSDALLALRRRPVFGAAGLLLKVSPALYRRLYSAYIKRVYDL